VDLRRTPPSPAQLHRSAGNLHRAARTLVVATSVLAGCASVAPPPPVQALAVPAGWSSSPASAARGTPLAGWWRRFDDPLLVDLIADALRANTTVRGAVSALAQARALADVQAAGLRPALRGSASAQRSRAGHASTIDNFQAGFDASWEPDVFGAQHAAVEAADADTVAGAASLGDVQVSVAAEVAVDYMTLRGLQARQAIAVANLQSQESTLQITQWRAQAGLLSTLEVEQARTASAQTRAQIPLLQTAAAQAEHSLAVLTGRPPAGLHDRLQPHPPASGLDPAVPADPAVPPMPTAPADLVLSFPAETLRQRADVRAAEARVTAAAARVTQADAARYPSFQLGGSLGLSALALGSLTSGSSVVASVLASVSAPLFDGGAGVAQVRAQQAALLQAGAAYDAAVLAALQDVEDSLAALRNDRDRLQSLRVAAVAAQNAALLARRRYASGLIDFQVVLETQRSLLGTQDSVAGTAADLQADHVRLYKALGGGWEPAALPGLAARAAR
jgi:NodT family efflux transporter outer membrane factor (OMF) lipoprotein